MEGKLRIIVGVEDLKTEFTAEVSTLLKDMSHDAKDPIDFTEPWPYSDITFVVDTRKVFANKTVLTLWSPVFEAMFQHDFKEKAATQIDLPEKNFDGLMELMRVLHPPNTDICENNVRLLLPLVQEYQIDVILERCEDFLLSQASSVRNFLLAEKYNLSRLRESNMAYLKRAPVSRLRSQPEFETLDATVLKDLLLDKCERFESNMDSLREVRMVLERKKTTTFPGAHLLCANCNEAREQQVDCNHCLKNCCRKITEILRRLEQY